MSKWRFKSSLYWKFKFIWHNINDFFLFKLNENQKCNSQSPRIFFLIFYAIIVFYLVLINLFLIRTNIHEFIKNIEPSIKNNIVTKSIFQYVNEC